jgi:hypothetical protein
MTVQPVRSLDDHLAAKLRGRAQHATDNAIDRVPGAQIIDLDPHRPRRRPTQADHVHQLALDLDQ